MAYAFPSQQPAWRSRELTRAGFSHKEAIVSIVQRQLGSVDELEPAKLRRLIFACFREAVGEAKRQRAAEDGTPTLHPASACVKAVRGHLSAKAHAAAREAEFGSG